MHYTVGSGGWVSPGRPTRSGRGVRMPGTYLPDATTTGVDPAITLTEVTDPVVISSPGTYSNLRFLNIVEIRAPRVTLRNCEFRGPAVASPVPSGIVDAKHPDVSELLLVDCTIKPRAPSHVVNCFEGHHFTWRRVDSSGGVDACSLMAPEGTTRMDARIEASWLHDLAFYSPTNTQSDNITHNDLIQWHGGLGLTIIGTRLEAYIDPAIGNANATPVGTWPGSHVSGNPWLPKYYATSGIMCAPARMPMGELTISKTWMNGGRVAINAGAAGFADMPNIGSITDSWFGTDFGLGSDYAILTNSGQALVMTGNHRWVAGDPLNTATAFNVRKP